MQIGWASFELGREEGGICVNSNKAELEIRVLNQIALKGKSGYTAFSDF